MARKDEESDQGAGVFGWLLLLGACALAILFIFAFCSRYMY